MTVLAVRMRLAPLSTDEISPSIVLASIVLSSLARSSQLIVNRNTKSHGHASVLKL